MSKSKPAVAADAASNESHSEATNDSAPRKRKVRVLAEAERDGKTVRVLTDDVRVWKETAE